MARDPARRAASREADRLRKQARRAAERYKKLASQEQNVFRKAEYARIASEQQARAKAIRAERSAGVMTYKARAQEAMEQQRTAPAVSAREAKARAFDFQDEMRKARRGEASALGKQGRERVQLFYRLTQEIWQGTPASQRNQRIIDFLRSKGKDVSAIEDAYLEIARTKEFRRYLRGMDTSGRRVHDTDSMQDAYYEAERTRQRIDTPDKIMPASSREFLKAYGWA